MALEGEVERQQLFPFILVLSTLPYSLAMCIFSVQNKLKSIGNNCGKSVCFSGTGSGSNQMTMGEGKHPGPSILLPPQQRGEEAMASGTELIILLRGDPPVGLGLSKAMMDTAALASRWIQMGHHEFQLLSGDQLPTSMDDTRT